MIPVLYDSTTTDFDNNGIGSLTDAMSCVVTEERNGVFELNMTYPITGKWFNSILPLNYIKAITKPGGTPQIFRIYGVTKPFNGIITVQAEHISYQLAYIPVGTYTASTAVTALLGLTQHSLINNPFTFWTDIQKTADYDQRVVANIRERMMGSEGSILDIYGGEWEFDNYSVKLHNHRGADRNVTLRYGKNITDIEQEESIAQMYTSAVGYYASGDGDYVETNVIDSEAASHFPYKRVEVVDLSSQFSEGTPTKAELTEVLEMYMEDHKYGVPKVSLNVSFVALWQTEEYKDVAMLERVWLCDTVKVVYEKLDITAEAQVIRTEYNVLLDRYNSIELGEAKTDLSNRIVGQAEEIEQVIEDTTTDLEKSIARATAMITGGLGGYVYLKPNPTTGYPEEILIMDSPNINTARNIWRMNQGGISHSSTGYNGDYTVGIYMNGEINASMITAGYLSANIIRGGYLMSNDANNNFALNMTTGQTIAKRFSVDTTNFKITEDGKIITYAELPVKDAQGHTVYYEDPYLVEGETRSDMPFRTTIGAGTIKMDWVSAGGISGAGATIFELNADTDGNTNLVSRGSFRLRHLPSEQILIEGGDAATEPGDLYLGDLTASGDIEAGGDVSVGGTLTADSASIGSDMNSDTLTINVNNITVGYRESGYDQSATAVGRVRIDLGEFGWLEFTRGLLTNYYINTVSGITDTINGVGDGQNSHWGDIEVENGRITRWSGWN